MNKRRDLLKENKESTINEISDHLDVFLTFLRNCEQDYRIALQSEQEANGETSDILHMLEFEDKDYHSMARMSKELKAIRQNRRKAKDKMNVLSPIVEWIGNNKDVIKTLERLLGTVRSAEKDTENRFYTPRTKKK